MATSDDTMRASHSSDGAGRLPGPARTRRRTWLFRLLAIGLSLAPFGVLECGLRWAGVGFDTRLVVRVPNDPTGKLFRLNPAADRSYYGVEDLWGPDPRPFQLPKPAGTFRVVVVGGSSVAGFPYPSELAMPRQLEMVLQRQLTGRTVEVLNTGMTAILSTSELDILRQSLACKPDLIIVHTGHNEFYGPGGSASRYSSVVSALYPLAQQAKRLRAVQLLLSCVPKPDKTHLVTALPTDIQIPLSGTVFEHTRQRFEGNLTRMADAAAQAHVPILLSTVPANLRDLAPLQPTENPETMRRLRDYERFLSYREHEQALAVLVAAHEEDPADPLVVYRQGQCLEILGRKLEAGERFVVAADLDGGRFRAATPFLASIRRVAERRSGAVYFCDVAAKLKDRSRLPAPGSDFFLEHVHFNLEGNFEVASILGETIVGEILGATWNPSRHPSAGTRDKLLGVQPLDLLAAESLTLIGFEAWPFNLSPVRIVESQRMQGRIGARYQELDPAERELFASMNMDAMQQHLWLAMGDGWLQRTEFDRAWESYQRHIRRRPWDSAGYLGAARVLRAQGKHAEADALLIRSPR